MILLSISLTLFAIAIWKSITKSLEDTNEKARTL